MGSLLPEVIPLALAASVSPILFVEVLAVLSGPGRLRRGLAFALGCAIPLVAVGVVILLVGDAVSLPKSPTAKAVIDVVLGVALLAFGLTGVRRPAPTDEAKAQRKQPSSDPRRTLVFGIGSMTTNVTSLAFYLPAMKLIGGADVSVASRVLVTALTIVIVLAPALIPLGLVGLAPEASTHGLTKLRDGMSRHGRKARVVLGIGFGVWLLVKGISALP